jgi:pSer/pThr/pTyr-binding forkhead associated (FHA) protein
VRKQAFNGIGGKMARLVLISKGVDFATHEFVGDIVFIGRTQSNQIVIDNSTVSAQHALLLRVGNSYRLKDLNSTNGTQINGVFVTEAELKDGDTIQFGSVTAVFEGGCRKPWSSRGAKVFGMNISV